MRFRSSAALALVVTFALPSASLAQGRDVYKLPTATPEMIGANMGRAQPGVSASSPTGFGPSQGDVFAGLGFIPKAPGTNSADGSLAIGFGFLDANDVIGIEAVLASLSTIRGGFGQRMAMSVKAHKVVRGWGFGLGLEGVMLNGGTDTDPSIYAAATRNFGIRAGAPYFNSGTINFGLGNGRFRSPKQQFEDDGGIGLFLSSSIAVNRWSAAIVDYSSNMINLGLSFAPIRNFPLVVTPVINDITGEGGDKARLSLGAGMSWKY